MHIALLWQLPSTWHESWSSKTWDKACMTTYRYSGLCRLDRKLGPELLSNFNLLVRRRYWRTFSISLLGNATWRLWWWWWWGWCWSWPPVERVSYAVLPIIFVSWGTPALSFMAGFQQSLGWGRWKSGLLSHWWSSFTAGLKHFHSTSIRTGTRGLTWFQAWQTLCVNRTVMIGGAPV